MNLTKFLRKNSRALLMVFMSLLLIAFLVPQSIQGCGERARMQGVTLGHAFGHAITTQSLLGYSQERDLVSRLGLPVPYEGEPVDFYLLKEEARRAGVHVSRDEVKKRLAQMGVTNDVMKMLRQQTGMAYDRIYDTIGDWMATIWLMEMESSALVTTVPRAEVAYRDETQQAVTRMSLVDAQALKYLVGEPTDEQLKAFFEECNGRFTAHTENELVYGYRLPDRVKIEWLTVDPAEVERTVHVKIREAREYFDQHRQEFMKPSGEPTVPGQAPKQVPMTFEEARDQAREAARMAKAVETAQSIINEIADAAGTPWRFASLDDQGFPKPPEGTEIPSFEALRKQFSGQYEVEYGQTGLVTAQELRRVAGIGQARVSVNKRPVSVPEMAFRVEGILENAPQSAEAPAMALDEPGPVAFRAGGVPYEQQYQPYVFRVTEVAPSGPRESMEGIRDEVIDDWKTVQAFQMAQKQAESLAENAKQVGLDEAVADANDLQTMLETGVEKSGGSSAWVECLQPFTPADLTRDATQLQPWIGRTTELPKKIFEYIEQHGTTTAEAHPVTVLPQADRDRWVVVEVLDVKPMYSKPFEQDLPQLSGEAQGKLVRQFVSEWWRPENIRARTGFVPTKSETESSANP